MNNFFANANFEFICTWIRNFSVRSFELSPLHYLHMLALGTAAHTCKKFTSNTINKRLRIILSRRNMYLTKQMSMHCEILESFFRMVCCFSVLHRWLKVHLQYHQRAREGSRADGKDDQLCARVVSARGHPRIYHLLCDCKHGTWWVALRELCSFKKQFFCVWTLWELAKWTIFYFEETWCLVRFIFDILGAFHRLRSYDDRLRCKCTHTQLAARTCSSSHWAGSEAKLRYHTLLCHGRNDILAMFFVFVPDATPANSTCFIHRVCWSHILYRVYWINM